MASLIKSNESILKSIYRFTDNSKSEQMEISFEGRNNESSGKGLCLSESRRRRRVVDPKSGSKLYPINYFETKYDLSLKMSWFL